MPDKLDPMAQLSRNPSGGREAFARVFSDVKSDEPFDPSVPARALLYPFGLEFERNELQAIASAARRVDEDKHFFCRSGFARPGGRSTWLLSFDDLGASTALGLLDRPILYSLKGRWGILCTHDGFALAGGPREFIETLLDQFPLQYPTTTSEDLETMGLDPRDRQSGLAARQAAFASAPTIRGNDQVKEFLRIVKFDRGKGRAWPRLRRMLEHIYGNERAHELLCEADLWSSYANDRD